MMTTSSLAMIVGIIRFENLIPVAPAAAPNSLTMISMMILLHLVAQEVHLHEAPVGLQPEVLVAAPGVLQRAHPVDQVAPLGVLLEAQVAVAPPARVPVPPPVVAPVVAPQVVAPPAKVQVVVLQVAHPRERALLVDHSRIQTPSPASRHPIVNSTLRAFSCSFTRSGVPEMTSATRTYHPPSMNMAMHATIARSAQVKSG